MSDVTSFEVTGDWRHIVDDGMVDGDNLPDEVPLTGKVVFKPVYPTVATAGVPVTAYTLGPVTALIAGGVLTDLQGRPGQRLAGKVGEHTVRWSAETSLRFQEQKVDYPRVTFDLTEDVRLTGIITQAGPSLTPTVVDPRIEALAASVESVNLAVVEAEGHASAAAEQVPLAKAEADRAIGLAGAQDEHVAGVLEDPQSATHAAFKAVGNATYARKYPLIVDARDHGVVADGVTNDAPAWNALVTLLEGTGATITWAGRSLLRGDIWWKKGVSLVGQSRSSAVLVKSNSHNRNVGFSAINWTRGYSTVASPFDDLVFADFTVDGTDVIAPAGAQWIHDKALFMQHMRRCTFKNLYLHDTNGTALGVDFLRDCIIESVVVRRGGKGWDGVTGGHAGIGIGQGATEIENCTIVNCHTIDCGHWGIFVEKQTDAGMIPGKPTGMKITSCTATGTRGSGFADYGCKDTIFLGNTAVGNGLDNLPSYREGITLMMGAESAQVVSNICTDNVGDGIGVKTTAGNYNVIAGNTSRKNGRRGIAVQAGDLFRGYSVRDNDCAENTFDGILFNGTNDDLSVLGNRCRSNGQGPTAAGAGADSGIAFGGYFTGLTVNSNRCNDDQSTKTQANGIGAASGTYSNTRFDGNNVTGNKTRGIWTSAATLAAIQWGNNTGALTTQHGSATIPDGQAFVTVPHSLMGWPTSVQLTPTANAPVWVTNIDGAGFRVNRSGTTGALAVHWTARLGG